MKVNNPCIYVGNQALVTKTYFVEKTDVISSVIKEVKEFVAGDIEIPSGKPLPGTSLREQLFSLSGNLIAIEDDIAILSAAIKTGAGTGTLDPRVSFLIDKIVSSSIQEGGFAILGPDNNEVHFVTKTEFDTLSGALPKYISTSINEILPAQLKQYVTSDELEAKLNDYVSSSNLSGYVKKEEIGEFIDANTLSGYATKDYVSDMLSGTLNLTANTFNWPDFEITSSATSGEYISSEGNIYTTVQYNYYPTDMIPSAYSEIYGKNIDYIFDCTISGIKGKILSCYMPHEDNSFVLTLPDVTWNSNTDTSSIHIVTNNKSELNNWIAFIGRTKLD